MRPVVILFARAPLPGKVKTRLLTRLAPEQAAALHECFVRDTLELLLTFSDSADIELHTDTPTDAWADLPVALFLQTPGGLGERMFHAITSGLKTGCSQVMIVGSDSPTIPSSHLRTLLASSSDVALGPTADGGFYAIACRRVHPDMFSGVRFSAASTLQDTSRSVQDCGLSLELGNPWFDVDTPRDLQRLARSSTLPRHTAKYLGQIRLTR